MSAEDFDLPFTHAQIAYHSQQLQLNCLQLIFSQSIPYTPQPIYTKKPEIAASQHAQETSDTIERYKGLAGEFMRRRGVMMDLEKELETCMTTQEIEDCEAKYLAYLKQEGITAD